MSWRIATRHVSSYRYASTVFASYNEARMTPVASHRQSVLESHVSIRPTAPPLRYVDYWATTVYAFDVHEPHDNLVVTGSSVVETAGAEVLNEDAGWELVHRPDVQDRYSELLLPTPYAPLEPALRDLAHDVGTSETPAQAVASVSAWVRSAMRYEPGTTQVSTSAVEAWRQGSGVCQDFAHLTLVLLRELGIPARYTSGYLHPRVAAAIGETVKGASHAWVEAWLGSWQPVDPTNGEPVGERHVTVARGRDYADVAPLHGLYHGGALEDLEVTVELTRVA
ncbi:MAG: transglutaminase domain protein [Acidimicrobiaceae bacterium]|jgi:transglutaminase-like putative cysteine protease|nr:transglutaminase domain protein [Acidimicrobiaceae bacterium]